jgi:hypothetical protein
VVGRSEGSVVWRWDVGIRHMGFFLSNGISISENLRSVDVVLRGVAGIPLDQISVTRVTVFF